MVRWLGTGFVIAGALFAAAGFVPLCFAIGAMGSFLWLIDADDKPLVVLNAFMFILNAIAYFNN